MPCKDKEKRKEYMKKYSEEYRRTHEIEYKKSQENYRKNYPAKIRNSNLKCHFGITLEQYNELFIIQKGCCSICGRHQSEFKRILGVDHDHETGRVRGLLCHSCNVVLGLIHDNPDILRSALDYLERYDNYVK
jgi:hypothetical protein